MLPDDLGCLVLVLARQGLPQLDNLQVVGLSYILKIFSETPGLRLGFLEFGCDHFTDPVLKTNHQSSGLLCLL